MALRDYPSRVLFSSVLSSLLLLVLCGTVAVLLVSELARTADVLEENIGSRQAAANLEGVLAALAVFHQRGVDDVAPLHERAEGHLADAEQFADKAQEEELVRKIAESYRKYLKLWATAQSHPGPKPALVHHLQDDTLPTCRRLQDYNTSQINESGRAHRASLVRMTWGLAAVGGLGSVAGLVLGYGLARSLRRTIHHFLVRVQGAADRLGPELATVEWQRDGDPLRDGADALLVRVEQAVLRLQQRERDLRRTERLAMMGQLAAGFAHEIRNPLTSALLLLQTARKDPSAGGLTDEDLDLIEQELHRVERSLQGFLDYARPPKLTRAACDLGDVVRRALALTRARLEQQGVAVDLDVAADCGLDADREQLQQMLLNLILNALDAMPHGGRLGLRIAALSYTVELTVTDTGPGITPPVLARLFEPFVTHKDTGLGLGLVVSKRIVEEHGGTIRGWNPQEGGASFVVRLPRNSSVPNGMERGLKTDAFTPGRSNHGDAAVDR